MSSIGFVVPVPAGKEQADRDWMSTLDGERREEYQSEWKKAGFKHHTVWQQETPNGTVDIVYLEADDIPTAMQAITSSDSPFHAWFRERVLDVHDLDLSKENPPQPTLLHDASF
ncbi:MAG: hypothetical protein QOI29_1344, partial [Mycobacterium sp.]|jgi:hypothetical protein|nr:hypothetical protein [Mycobacterium sp.]